MSYTLIEAVTCKHCGSTVMIEKLNCNNSDSIFTGSLSTKSCPKCHKSSSYSYKIKNKQFVDLR
jgi:ribosomal protein S27E